MTSTFRPELIPTWAKIAAWAVPFTTVPSITWRLEGAVDGLVSGGNACFEPASTPLGEKIYIVALLPIVQLSLALLTLGLIRPWGEVFPRWIPGVGGRRVPIAFAVGLAMFGVLALSVMILGQLGGERMLDELWAALGRDHPPGGSELPAGCEKPGWEIMRWYVPMILWPPLLFAVTMHYLRRRRRPSREMIAA